MTDRKLNLYSAPVGSKRTFDLHRPAIKPISGNVDPGVAIDE
jgi:hypothetical protein